MNDYAKMPLDDLTNRICGYCGDDVVAIRAEIARRISVRDRVVRQFMEDGAWHKIDFNHGTTVETDDDYNPTYYDENGEQIL